MSEHTQQPLTRSTRRKDQVVNLAADPNTVSQAEIGRKLGITRQTVGEHLAKPDVQQAIIKKKQGLLDKATSRDRKAEKIEERLLERVATLAESVELTPQEAAGCLKIVFEYRTKTAELKEKLGNSDEREQMLLDRFDGWKAQLRRRSVKLGLYLYSRAKRAAYPRDGSGYDGTLMLVARLLGGDEGQVLGNEEDS